MTEFWWIFPLIMVIFCIFMMRRCMGSMMCGHDSHDAANKRRGTSKEPT